MNLLTTLRVRDIRYRELRPLATMGEAVPPDALPLQTLLPLRPSFSLEFFDRFSGK